MRFATCPTSPNCVSTEATDRRHGLAPYFLARKDAWPEIRAAVLALPRVRLVDDREGSLRAECRSALAGFIDDLAVQVHENGEELAVRSAARLGYYDFGVNRRRAEALRKILRARGIIR